MLTSGAVWKCVVQQVLESAVGPAMKRKERIKDRISEGEYHDRVTSLMNSDFNTQLEPLRSLKTATKKRRELKKKAYPTGDIRKMKGAAN